MNRKSIQKKRLWFGLHCPEAVTPDIAVIGIPYDGAVCYRAGAAQGPDRIRVLSDQIPAVVETGETLSGLVVRDDGNLSCTHPLSKSFARIEREVAARAARGFVLTLGGDHSIAIPVHRAFSRVATADIGLIFVDAHTDLSDHFDGSPFSHACPLRRTMETDRFSPENTILVATRCFEPAGLDFIQKHGMKMFPAWEVAERGMRAVATEIIQRMRGLQNVYLSLDIDALDPAFAPGTGIPDAGGVSVRDALTLLRMLDALPMIGADLVEVAPPLDISDITSFAAVKIIAEIFAIVQRRKQRNARCTPL